MRVVAYKNIKHYGYYLYYNTLIKYYYIVSFFYFYIKTILVEEHSHAEMTFLSFTTLALHNNI